MPAAQVIEFVVVLRDAGFGLAMGFRNPAPDQFGFDGLEERLDNGLVIAIALAAHRRPQAVFAQTFLVVVRTVLTTTVAVKDAAQRRGPERDGHFQRADRQIAFHGIADSPADHAPGVQGQDDRQIEPALAGPDMADVASPFLIRSVGSEVAVQRVWDNVEGMIAVRHACAPGSSPVLRVM
jgi:hypothetical protein